MAPVWDGTHEQKKKIQSGIDAAVGGDSVTVSDGIYKGAGNRDISFNGKAILLRSQNGADSTIIDCEGAEATPRRGCIFNSGETLASILEGFTIIEGYAL